MLVYGASEVLERTKYVADETGVRQIVNERSDVFARERKRKNGSFKNCF